MAKTKKALSKPAKKLLERIHDPNRFYKPMWVHGATDGKYMTELFEAGFVLQVKDAYGTWRIVPKGFRVVERWRNGQYKFNSWPKPYVAPVYEKPTPTLDIQPEPKKPMRFGVKS